MNSGKPKFIMECKICHKIFKTITNSHLKKHGLTPKEYEYKFGCKTVPSGWLVGEDNPFYGKHHEKGKSKVKSKEYSDNVSKRIKNKTYEELYGIEKAAEIKTIRSKRFTGKNNPNYNRLGNKSPNWKGGYIKSGYPYYFNKRLKSKIRKRENNKCFICGKSEIELDKVLDIHHIDYDRFNCDRFNLVALCRNCHSETNYGNRNFWTYMFSNMLYNKYGNPEPSLEGNFLEGATTSFQFQTDKAVDSNETKSAQRPNRMKR